MTATTPPAGWALEVARDDLAATTLVEAAVPEPADGEAVLRVDRVGLTANNVTYAVLGESFRYWESSRRATAAVACRCGGSPRWPRPGSRASR